jgi:hypothetical protein
MRMVLAIVVVVALALVVFTWIVFLQAIHVA